MLKIGFVSLIGIAVLGWFVLGPGQMLPVETPPTIRADFGPLRHRPEGALAQQDQWRGQHQATRISSQQGPQDASTTDALLRLSR
ncbi:MAG: hypothetical protein GKS02_05510 [Alphaproteobacteria bacterium]|nr:hypothetical protein [Alphaproteobacteria bacterium]